MNQKVRKQKNLTKCLYEFIRVNLNKPKKHFSDLTATKVGLQNYHKIKKQDTKNVSK